mgnify:CR=1 FL=1
MTYTENDISNKQVFLFDILKRYDHYIGTTNFKIGLIMSFLAAIILGLTLRIIILPLPEDEIFCFYILSILFSSLTILISLISAGILLRAVFPELQPSENNHSLIYFGNVAQIKGGENAYFKDIANATEHDLLTDLAFQTHAVAKVVNNKFKKIKLSVNITTYGVVPFLGISILFLIIEAVR